MTLRKKGDICKETPRDGGQLVIVHVLTDDPDKKGLAYVVTLRVGSLGKVSLDTESVIDVNRCGWDANREWLVLGGVAEAEEDAAALRTAELAAEARKVQSVVLDVDEYCPRGCGEFSHHPPTGDCPKEYGQ